MITKENFQSVINNIGEITIDEALNAAGDYISIILFIFNAGSIATISSCDYNEDMEVDAAANGNLYLDKSDFIMLLSELINEEQ